MLRKSTQGSMAVDADGGKIRVGKAPLRKAQNTRLIAPDPQASKA
jgi:hypothetical protein